MRAIAPRPRIGTGHEAPRGSAAEQPVDLSEITGRLAAAEAALAALQGEQGKQAASMAVMARDIEEVKQPKAEPGAEVFR